MKRFAIICLTLLLIAGSERAWAAASAPPAMIVPGQFNVSSTGAATYTVPISVPPGSAGMVPALSLGYSSQSGDGIAGLGWTLSGLPSISRCPRTIAQDGIHGSVNYSTADRLCMEGQRLIYVSGGAGYGTDGSLYHTEVESFSKIVEHNDIDSTNAWFEVWTKSGQHMQFGNSTDSQILTVGLSTPVIRAWSVNKISDTVGNYLTVTYNCAPLVSSACSDPDRTVYGEAYPLEVDYTGNALAGVSPYNSVKFVYQCQDAAAGCRADSVPMYQAGALTQTTVLLSNIQTYQGANLVYNYKLGYRAGTSVTHSRMTSVTLCDTAGICLQPTTFGWQGGVGYLTLSGTAETVAQDQMIAAGDFLGNGLTDIVPIASTYTPCPSTLPIYNGPSFSTSTASFPNALAGEPNCGFKPLVQTVLAPNGVANVLAQESFGSTTFLVIMNTYGAPGAYTVSYTNSPGFAGDLNGDGIPDIFVQGFMSHYFLASAGGGFAGPTSDGSYNPSTTATGGGDFDGDGCIDVFANGGINSIDYNPSTYCSPAVSTSTPPTASGYLPILGDFNGDGKTDILLVSQSGAAQLWLSTGVGFTEVTSSLPTDWGKYAIAIGDWNGDGKADLLLIASGASGFYGSGTPHQLWLSTGTGFVQAVDSSSNPITIANSATTASATSADWNNDGATDFWLQQPTAAGGDQLYTSAYVPELLTTVTNGVGSTTNVSYGPINTNGSFYTKGTTAAYPTQDVDGALYVVSRVDASNGLGTCNPSVSYTNCYSSGYAYAGAQTDLTGRGFLGFGSISITDLQTNIVQQTTYSTQFPLVGMVLSQVKNLNGNSNPLSTVTNMYAYDSSCWSSTAPPTGVYQVCLTQTATTGYDLNDTAVFPSTTTNYTYDDFGNALTVNVSVSDGSSKNTTNTYANDTTNWFLGRLLGTSVTSTVGSLTLTRQSSFAYDATTGLLTEEDIEPGVSSCNSGSSSCELTTGYTYDAFGHRVTTTVFGTGITTRVSQAFYDSNGEFQTSAENALGQTENWTYDARFGGPASHTGPNLLSTYWTYDTLGRMIAEVRPDGTQTQHSYSYCSTGCPTYGQFYAAMRIVAPDGAVQIGPSSVTYYDMLSRDIADDTQGFDGSNVRIATVYDGNGRVQETSRPYFTASASPAYTSFVYDALGRVTQSTFPDASQSNYVFNGLVTSVTNSLSQTTTTTKNAQGLIASVQDALGHTTSYVYDPFNNPITTTDPLGNVVSNTYDIRGHKVVSNDPDMGSWSYAYDVLGELTKQIDGNGNNSTLAYDVLGRPVTRSESDLQSNWTYGTSVSLHNVGKIIEAKACSTPTCSITVTDRQYTYDALTRPAQTTLLTGGANYVYSETYNSTNGQLALTTYPSGFILNHIYNQFGYICRLTDFHFETPNCASAGAGTTSYVTVNSRDAELHLTSSTAGSGIVTTQAFNPLTGLIENTNAGPSSSVAQFAYAFDTIGNLTARTDYDESFTETFCYDGLNRLTSYDITSACPGGKTVSYDDIGNITAKSDTGTYAYAASGAASHLPHAVSSIAGTVDGLTNPQYSYDGNGSLTCTSTGAGCTGTVGRRLAMTSYNMTASVAQGGDLNYFVYDDQHSRVSQVNSASGTITATTYLNDAASGAMSEHVVSGPGAFTKWDDFSWGGTTWGGTLPAGEPVWVDYIMLDGQIVAQQKTAYGPGYTSSTQWNAFSWGSAPWFGGGFVAAPWGGSNWAASNWGGYVAITTNYFVLDHLGSVAVITDSAGNVIERQSYDAWGKQRNPNGTDSPCGTLGSVITRGFTNQEQLPTQCLVNLNARLYDPSIGKFMAADPIIGDPMIPNAYNRYVYVLNNPLSLEDPNGLCFLGCFFKSPVFGAVIGIALISFGLPELEGINVLSGGSIASLSVPTLLANGALAGAASAGLTGGNILKGAFLGGLQAGLFDVAGDFLQQEAASELGAEAAGIPASTAENTVTVLGSNTADTFVAHGLVGGIVSAAGGSSFGSGFLAGGVGSLAESPILKTSNFAANVAENAVLGGAGSVLGGGKFENGAVTAAFGYVFNSLAHAYSFRERVCQYADPACSTANAWDALLHNAYPGQDPSTTVQNGQKYSVFGAQSEGAITTVVNEADMTITNITESTHIFCCGFVSLQILGTDTGVDLSITGRGSNTNVFTLGANYFASLFFPGRIAPAISSYIDRTYLNRFGPMLPSMASH